MRRTLVIAAALLVAACGRDAETPAEAPAAPPAAAIPAAPAPAAPAAQRPAPPADIALDGEGLRFVNAATGSTRLLPFGAPEAQALEALQPLRGAPAERSTNEECGAGPLAFAEWPDQLQLVFQDGRFVGWSLDRAGLATMSGVGVGSTRADLQSAYDAQVQESTLGTEFSAGGLSGLLSGPGREAKITTIWGGTICAFR